MPVMDAPKVTINFRIPLDKLQSFDAAIAARAFSDDRSKAVNKLIDRFLNEGGVQ